MHAKKLSIIVTAVFLLIPGNPEIVIPGTTGIPETIIPGARFLKSYHTRKSTVAVCTVMSVYALGVRDVGKRHVQTPKARAYACVATALGNGVDTLFRGVVVNALNGQKSVQAECIARHRSAKRVGRSYVTVRACVLCMYVCVYCVYMCMYMCVVCKYIHIYVCVCVCV